MCSAAPSIGKGPSIQRPLSGHSGHGRTRCWPAPVVIDPKQSLAEEFWCIAARALPRLKIRFPRSKKVKKIDPSIFASLRHA
jgi:hypothetical protein